MSDFRDRRRQLQFQARQAGREKILKSKRNQFCESESIIRKATVQEVKKLAQELIAEQNIASLKLLRQSAENSECIEAFLSVEGSLPNLVSILTSCDANKQLEAVMCIANLASGSHKTTSLILEATSVYLITFLHGSNPSLQSQCLLALVNMIEDCQECRFFLKAQGILPALFSTLKSPDCKVIQDTLFALRCYTFQEVHESRELVNLGIINILEEYLSNNELQHSGLIDAAYILFHISTLVTDVEAAFHQEHIIQGILNSLSRSILQNDIDILLATPLIRCIGSLSISEKLIHGIVGHPALSECVRKIFTSDYHHLKKEMLWVLINIIGGRHSSIYCHLDISSVLDAIPSFLSVIDTAAAPALYFLCGLLKQERHLYKEIINRGILANVEALLQYPTHEATTGASLFLSVIANCASSNI